MRRITSILLALLMALGLSVFSVAQTQDEPFPDEPPADEPPVPGEQPPMPGEEPISDEDLQRFVDVQDQLQAIVDEYSVRLETAESPEEALELQQEAGELMMEAVEDTGLDVETYNEIAVAIEVDEGLRQRIQNMMEGM